MTTIFSPRKLDSHKGDYGKVFILAGSLGMSGAAILAAKGALRTGAGLVFLGIPQILNQIVETELLEVISKPLKQTKDGCLSLRNYSFIYNFIRKIDALVLGPGLSQNRETQRLIRRLIKTVKKPLVIDADAINALAGNLSLLLSPTAKQQPAIKVITPHPGELAHLLKIDAGEIQKKREEIAVDFARRYKLTVVLKGFRTIVTDGEGEIYINRTGNPGMATAGMGDILSGMLGALLARGFSPFKAAKAAVYLHGAAGDLAVREKGEEGMIASDVVEKIPEAIKLNSDYSDEKPAITAMNLSP
ncbi:MAG: NAD(P)H-hydrate dehydratase [Candidatus Omnitrophica bacterium]|nr:NAD(P)H-hydrate dehydratase [Candidatus Omnitrophota bacterium]